MADVKEKFATLVQQYPTYQESNTTSVSTQTAEGEIKYSQEELEQIVAELQQINEETSGELQQAEGYVTTIYDNGNLDAGSQEVLVEVKEDIANQRKGIEASLTGLKDFLAGVKNRFEDAETKVKARLQGWLDKFKGNKNDPQGIASKPQGSSTLQSGHAEYVTGVNEDGTLKLSDGTTRSPHDDRTTFPSTNITAIGSLPGISGLASVAEPGIISIGKIIESQLTSFLSSGSITSSINSLIDSCKVAFDNINRNAQARLFFVNVKK